MWKNDACFTIAQNREPWTTKVSLKSAGNEDLTMRVRSSTAMIKSIKGDRIKVHPY